MRDRITMNAREDRKLIRLSPTRATVNKSRTASDGCFQHDLYVSFLRLLRSKTELKYSM